LPQAGDGIPPGSFFVDPDPHPADEALGALSALSGPGERDVDEVSGGPDDTGRHRGDHRRFGATLLFFLLQFVAQAFALIEVLFEERQEVVGEALENRMALIGFNGAGPRFASAHLTFERVEKNLCAWRVQAHQRQVPPPGKAW